MAKKQVAVSLRKPPVEANEGASDRAAFLEAAVSAIVGDSTPQPPRSAPRRARVVTTTTHATSTAPQPTPGADAFVGASAVTAMERSGVTAHLPDVLARRLAAFCIAHERSVDDVLAEAVANHLDRIQPPAPSSRKQGYFVRSVALTEWLRERVTTIGNDLRSFVTAGASILRSA